MVTPIRSPRARHISRRIHLWIGIGLGLLIFPISLSGALLVFDTEVDRLLDPSHYAVTGPVPALPLRVYLDNAVKETGGEATLLRWPAGDGMPVTVLTQTGGGRGDGEARRDRRADNAAQGRGDAPRAPARLRQVYLDPPTGHVLAVAGFRDSFVSAIHRFHENLTIPQFSGRQIVGWVGVGMFIMCVSGIVIWWPRNRGFLRGLAWRRGPRLSGNLHHLLGFWIAIPLGLMSLTGMYLAFPPQARTLISTVAPMAPRGERQSVNDIVLRRQALDPQKAVDIALALSSGARLQSLAMPTEKNKAWQVRAVLADGAVAAVSVDDSNGEAKIAPPPQSGDAIGAWMRGMHSGREYGVAWRVVALLCGLFPPVLLISGIFVWLRRRRGGARIERRDENATRPARIVSDVTAEIAAREAQSSPSR